MRTALNNASTLAIGFGDGAKIGRTAITDPVRSVIEESVQSQMRQNATSKGLPRQLRPVRHLEDQALVSIVVPTRHEASTIGAFLNRLADALGATTFEIIVVDDSDKDNTVDVLHAVQRQLGDDRLIVVHRPRGTVADRTLGSAVVTGIRLARGTYVCVLDADGQHPPEVISQLIDTAERTDAEYVGA
jgi:cellulose synthase/poly-beta-1,6-N-acetylglucosamine synthase-like glycosyltransferase